MKKFSFLILAVISSLFLTSCSTLRVGYSFIDWYLVNEIDDRFDLDSDQKEKVEEVVDRLQYWHRTEEIPRTIAILDQARDRMQGNIEIYDLRWMDEEWAGMIVRIVEQVADDVSTLLTSLSDEQIDHLEASFAERHREHEEENEMSDEEWREEKSDKISQRLNDWFGSLSEEQEAAILSSYHFDRSVQMQYREQSVRVQKRFIAFLRTRPSAEVIKSSLSSWITEPEKYYPEDYRKFIEQQRVRQAEFYMTIDQTINREQRMNAANRLKSYRDDLEEIHQTS